MSFSLSNSSQKLLFFAVLMYALYGHPGYFKFKGKYQQYGPCFQTISPFLMAMVRVIRLRKWESDLQFLCKCDDSNVTPKFLNFCFANSHHKYSSTYRFCQLNQLREEIHQKKSSLRSLQKELTLSKCLYKMTNLTKKSLIKKTNLIDIAYVSTLFFGITDKILKSKSLV